MAAAASSNDITSHHDAIIRQLYTRVLRLHAGSSDDVLSAELIVAGLLYDEGVALSMSGPRVRYEAISYCWGEEHHLTVPILVNGLGHHITTSLAVALRQFRYEDRPRYLWADSLCINQNENNEKSAQVAKMGAIFRQAARVLVWLGEEGINTSMIVPDSLLENLLAADADSKRRVNEALQDICTRPWIRRVWVQQEVRVARDVVLCCGTYAFDYAHFRKLARQWQRRQPRDMYAGDWLKAIESLVPDARKRKRLMQSSEEIVPVSDHADPWVAAAATSQVIERFLLRSSYLLASDPRDLVYALIGLTDCSYGYASALGLDDQSQELRVDYSKTLSEVFQDATRCAMNRNRGLHVLQKHPPGSSHCPRLPGLPSWVVDWSSCSPVKAPAVHDADDGDAPVRLHFDKWFDSDDWEPQVAQHDGTIHVTASILATFMAAFGDRPNDMPWYDGDIVSTLPYLPPPVCVPTAIWKTAPNVHMFEPDELFPSDSRLTIQDFVIGDILAIMPGLRSIAHLRPTGDSRWSFQRLMGFHAFQRLLQGWQAPTRDRSRQWDPYPYLPPHMARPADYRPDIDFYLWKKHEHEKYYFNGAESLTEELRIC